MMVARPGYYGLTGTSTAPQCDGKCPAGYACPASTGDYTNNICATGKYALAGAATCSPCTFACNVFGVTYGVEPTGLHTQPLRPCTAQAWVGMRVVLLVVCHRSASACPCAGIGRWYRQVRLDGLGTRLVSPTHSAADRALRASGARRATSTSGALAPVTRSSIVLRAAPTRRRCRAPQVSW